MALPGKSHVTCISRALRSVCAMIRMGSREFILVQPGGSHSKVQRVIYCCDQLCMLVVATLLRPYRRRLLRHNYLCGSS